MSASPLQRSFRSRQWPVMVLPPGARLRIALLSYRSNPYSGGQGVYVHYLSRALAELGHSVDVISGEPYPYLDPRVKLRRLPGLNLYARDDGVSGSLRLHYLARGADIAEWSGVVSGGFPEPRCFGLRLVPWMRRHGRFYDVVHDNQSLCTGLLELQAAGWPLLATIHHPITRDRDMALEAAKDWLHRTAVRRWYTFVRMQARVARRLRHMVAVSESSRKDTIKAFTLESTALRVIHNGIDTVDFRPVPEVEPKPGRIITTASADIPMKGLAVLLHALAKLDKSVELVVIGRLQPRGPTAGLIARLDLGDRITLYSQLSVAEIRQLYSTAEVAVVPSLYEGFGLPAAEAMACGVPVISSDAGALPEIVADAGILTPAGDSDALVDALSRLLGAPRMRARLGKQGRARVERHFSWHLAAQRYTDMYREVIAAHGP